jgi:hypothetical protein
MRTLSIKFKGLGKMLLLFTLASLMFIGCSKTHTHEKPKLTITADTLVFKGNETHSLFVTTNNPTSREFYVDYPYSWVSANPSYGKITADETVEIKLTSYFENSSIIKEDFLYVVCPYDEKAVTLIGLPEGCNLHIVPDTLLFPLDIDSVVMRIGNYDNTAMDYSITASNSFISFSPTSGRVSKMQSTDITVCIDRTSLLSEPDPELFVTIGNKVDTVLIIPERKLKLPNDVVDAEYAKATNLLVYVSSDSKLNIYHPENRTLSSVALSYKPTCVSISPDGTKATVGHDKHVTYIDLMAETVLTVNEVSCDALDIVLTDNSWTYVFPRRDQSERIRCLNVSTDLALETLHTGSYIYAGTKAKLHPSGKFIYGAQPHYEMEKYDIQEGTARYLYQAPSYSYSTDGDLWFEENGERAFTRSGTVVKTNDVQSTEMVEVGEIALESSYTRIAWLDHLELKNEVYMVLEGGYVEYDNQIPNPPYIYVYNSEDLTYKTKIRTEDFHLNTEYGPITQAAEPCFVFAHSNGTQLYVITKTDIPKKDVVWTIETIDR